MTGLFPDEAAAQLDRERVATEATADLRAREADYTPPAIVRECLLASMNKAIQHAARSREPGKGPAKVRVLDVGAGAGVWLKTFISLWQEMGGRRSELHVTAVELDPRERPHLEGAADRVIIGDWTRALGGHPGPARREYDIVIGNPPFSALRAQRADFGRGLDPDLSMPARLLEVAPAVALLSRVSAWSKDKPGISVRRKYPAAYGWEIPGAVSFRAEGGTDQHSYAVFLWLRGHTGPTSMDLLRDFTADERRWRVRPGTE